VKYVRVINQTSQATTPILAKYCQSFACQLRGLMFTRDLGEDQGLILAQGKDSIINATIHMMFMQIDLAVIWINRDFSVVDTVLAKKWKLAYRPKQAARYVLETGVQHLTEFHIGDKIRFDEVS